MTAAGGVWGVRGYYYEVEVLAEVGSLFVGFAGTNLGPQCQKVGNDACSWSCEDDGYVWHRCVREGVCVRSGLARRAKGACTGLVE